jgi:DNA-binding winged helix-turn-helix (wHTH) protein
VKPQQVIAAALSRPRDETAGELAERIIKTLDRRGFRIQRKEFGGD